MTTNLSLDEITTRLDLANTKDENIRITTTIGSKIEFLDVFIENNNGQLRTSVFHKPAAEPYILPYLSDHPRHVHRSTVTSQLLRAARLCSHVEDFDQERINIEFTLLLNDYPPKFLSYHIKKFHEKYQVLSLMEQLDQVIYEKFHRELLNQPTLREKNQQNLYLQDNQQQNLNNNEIYIHYTFESGSKLKFQKELNNLWKTYYLDNNPIRQNLQLKIGTRSNKSLHQLLVKKKPSKTMLLNTA